MPIRCTTIEGPALAGAGRPYDPAGSILWSLLKRLAMVALVVGVVGLAPWGGILGPVRLKHALMTLLTIAGIGKTLYDTLYYDRFRL